MHDRELYRRILGIEAPWTVADVEVDLKGDGVAVHIEHSGSELSCPECGTTCPAYDTRPRKWRHLDTCQYATWLVARKRNSERTFPAWREMDPSGWTVSPSL